MSNILGRRSPDISVIDRENALSVHRMNSIMRIMISAYQHPTTG